MEHCLIFLINIIIFTSPTILFFGFFYHMLFPLLRLSYYFLLFFLHYFLSSFFTTAFPFLTILICFSWAEGLLKQHFSLHKVGKVVYTPSIPKLPYGELHRICCFQFVYLLVGYTGYVVVLVESSSVCQFFQFDNALQLFYPSFLF